MRNRFKTTMALLLACCAYTSLVLAAPVGNTFTYQGRLNHAGSPVAVPQDLEFRLYDAATGGTEIGTANSALNVEVNNGLFSLPLNFGAGAFGNEARYLEINVRPSGTGAAYTTLAPRQPITPAPVALSVAAGGVNSTALAPGAVNTNAIAPGAITREQVSADFTPILVAETSFSKFVSSGSGGFYFDFTSKIGGFFHSFPGYTPQHSGYYMISVSFTTEQSSPPGRVTLLVNGVERHSFGNFGPDNSLNSEIWLQLTALVQVAISVKAADGHPFCNVAPGAQLRIVRVD